MDCTTMIDYWNWNYWGNAFLLQQLFLNSYSSQFIVISIHLNSYSSQLISIPTQFILILIHTQFMINSYSSQVVPRFILSSQSLISTINTRTRRTTNYATPAKPSWTKGKFYISHDEAYQPYTVYISWKLSPKPFWGMSRFAKCHGYGGDIRVKMLGGWGKKSGKTHSFAKSSIVLGKFEQLI